MNVIGPIFAVVCILMLLYFGLGSTQVMMDDATNSVGNDTQMSDSLNTSIELVEPTFSIMNGIVYLLILVAVIGVLYMLLKVI